MTGIFTVVILTRKVFLCFLRRGILDFKYTDVQHPAFWEDFPWTPFPELPVLHTSLMMQTELSE